jgi:hypothetical protein
MANKKANATKETKETIVTTSELISAAPKSWRDALGNILLEVPKSAQKMVTSATEFLFKSQQTHAHNSIECGNMLAKVQAGVTEATFSRLINEVWSRVGISRSTVYQWIKNATVLAVAVANPTAQDALLVVTGGRGLFSTSDGTTTLTGGFVAGIKKHPVPATNADYDDCLDWAREVLIVAEKSGNGKAPSAGEVYKAAIGRFKVLLEGNKKVRPNYKMAVECVVEMYRTLYAKSEPLALAAFEGIESGDMSLSAVGDLAMTNLRAKSATASATASAVRVA